MTSVEEYTGACRADGNAVYNYRFDLEDVSPSDYWHPSERGQATLAQVAWEAGFWSWLWEPARDAAGEASPKKPPRSGRRLSAPQRQARSPFVDARYPPPWPVDGPAAAHAVDARDNRSAGDTLGGVIRGCHAALRRSSDLATSM
jgi:hypothetical protein